MSDIRKSALGLILGLALFLTAVTLLIGQPAAPSYADTVPTPVSAQAGSGSTSWLAVTFYGASTAVDEDTYSTAQQLPGYDTLDYQYVIDQADAATNTTTLTLQWSNDNTNWSDGPNLVASNSADADGMVQAANMGRYTRVYANVTNTNTLTVTVKAIAKP